MATSPLEDLNKRIYSYKEKFDAHFKVIVNELVEEEESNKELTEVGNWLRKALEYNAFDGKKSRGMMVIGTVDFIRQGNPTEDEIMKAICLGWCVEILQAVFLIADDIMDRSELRRGRPCWYKKSGLIAINDTYLLEQCIYKLIDKYFAGDAMLIDLYKSFHQVTYLTAMGQSLDMFASEPPESTFSLELFTDEKYKSIVKYKTAYYSFYLPVSLGLRIVQMSDKNFLKEVEYVLMKLGEYFQIQDDYLDCYGDPKVIGKIGRDIEDGKCSWLVVQALKIVNDEQRKTLELNYGKESKECVNAIKELYNQLELKSMYEKYERESYESLCTMINAHPNGFPRELFFFLVKKIYKRQK